MSSSSSKSSFSKFSATVTGEGGTETQQQMSISRARRLSNKHQSSLNLDEEYNKALRTKSYIIIYSENHRSLNRASSTITPTSRDDEQEEQQRLFHAHSSPLFYQNYLNNCIPNWRNKFRFVPTKKSLFLSRTNMLLLDFFDMSRQAYATCTALLSSIDRARSHHLAIHRLLTRFSLVSEKPSVIIVPTKMSERCITHGMLNNFSAASECTSSTTLISKVSSHLELGNPLSQQNLASFNLIHSLYPSLIRRLTSTKQKISRRLRIVVFVKKVFFKGWVRLERARDRVDSAAKGAYIVGRDLDTMSRMVKRVHDEVEHGRELGRMVVRCDGEWEMVKEVVKEMGVGVMGLEEKLEELEQHVYLCLSTINWSRRLCCQ